MQNLKRVYVVRCVLAITLSNKPNPTRSFLFGSCTWLRLFVLEMTANMYFMLYIFFFDEHARHLCMYASVFIFIF